MKRWFSIPVMSQDKTIRPRHNEVEEECGKAQTDDLVRQCNGLPGKIPELCWDMGMTRTSICCFPKGAFLHAQGFISSDPMTQHTSALIMEVSSLGRAKKREFLTNYWKAGENMGWFSGNSFFSWKHTITTASGLADAVSWASQKPQHENKNGENISTETLKLLCHKNNWQKLPELEIKGRLQNRKWQALSTRRTEPCGEAD